MISHTRRPRGSHRQNKPEERVKKCLLVPFINGKMRPGENRVTCSRSHQTSAALRLHRALVSGRLFPSPLRAALKELTQDICGWCVNWSSIFWITIPWLCCKTLLPLPFLWVHLISFLPRCIWNFWRISSYRTKSSQQQPELLLLLFSKVLNLSG